MKAKIFIKADSQFPINRKRIRQVIKSALTVNEVEAEVEISVFVGGDRKMKSLTQMYFKKDKPMAVLSFPLESTSEPGSGFADSPDGVLRLGDIVISYPQALKQAVRNNVLVDEEIEVLIEHGIKHLLGIK
jgi:probable rRNA maturation factor